MGGASQRRRRNDPGAAPGTILPAPGSERTELRIIAYDRERLEERTISDPAELARLKEEFEVVWLDVRGLGDVELLKRLGDALDLHMLALEDVVSQNQTPKVEEWGDTLYFVLQAPSATLPAATSQVDVFVREGLVCTFQEKAGGWLEPVRRRIREGRKRIRASGADYLAYAVVDAVIDHYYPVADQLGDLASDLEESILQAASRRDTARVNDILKELLILKRAVSPLRDALRSLLDADAEVIAEDTLPFFRDIHDHAVQLVGALDAERDRARGLIDLALSEVSFRTNEIMRVLTIISTIFIPLGFLAGLYGMNFDREASPFNLPELGFRFGYPVLLGVMLAIAVVLLIVFRSRGWIGGRRDRGDGDHS